MRRDVHSYDDVEQSFGSCRGEEAGDDFPAGRNRHLVEIFCRADANGFEASGFEDTEKTTVVRSDVEHTCTRFAGAPQSIREPLEISLERAAGAACVEIVLKQLGWIDKIRQLPVRARRTARKSERECFEGIAGAFEQ